MCENDPIEEEEEEEEEDSAKHSLKVKRVSKSQKELETSNFIEDFEKKWLKKDTDKMKMYRFRMGSKRK